MAELGDGIPTAPMAACSDCSKGKDPLISERPVPEGESVAIPSVEVNPAVGKSSSAHPSS